jgi:hypothetical protein
MYGFLRVATPSASDPLHSLRPSQEEISKSNPMQESRLAAKGGNF